MSDSDISKDKNLEDMGLPKPFKPQEKSFGNVEVPTNETNGLISPTPQETKLEQDAITNTEKLKQVEQITLDEQNKEKIERKSEKPLQEVEPIPQATVVAQDDIKDELEEKIEEIMSEDLGEEYKKMSPKEQQKFKEVGEETASKIKKILIKSKVNIRKIIGLLVKWLKMIPGINKYFLQQEAKIKADKLLDVKDELSNK